MMHSAHCIIVASVASALEVRQVHAGLSHNLVAHITGTLEVGPNGVRSSLATGLGQAQLIELTHEKVRRGRYRLALRFAPSGMQRSFPVLRQLLDFAVDNRLLSMNPSERTVLPLGSSPRRVFST